MHLFCNNYVLVVFLLLRLVQILNRQNEILYQTNRLPANSFLTKANINCLVMFGLSVLLVFCGGSQTFLLAGSFGFLQTMVSISQFLKQEKLKNLQQSDYRNISKSHATHIIN